jgi:hypothetical protein
MRSGFRVFRSSRPVALSRRDKWIYHRHCGRSQRCRRSFTGPLEIFEELTRPSLNRSLNRKTRDPRENSDELHLQLNLSLIRRQGLEGYPGLQRYAPAVAEELRTAVALEVHQHLVHCSAKGAVGFNPHAALRFPRPPAHPTNLANVGAPSPGVGLGIDREDGRNRTIDCDPNLKGTHGSADAKKTSASWNNGYGECRGRCTEGQLTVKLRRCECGREKMSWAVSIRAKDSRRPLRLTDLLPA